MVDLPLFCSNPGVLKITHQPITKLSFVPPKVTTIETDTNIFENKNQTS